MNINERCPLCGENVVGGQCPSCGYVLPDKDELDYMTNMMDADPVSYPAPEPEPEPEPVPMPMRDVTPEEAAEQDIFPPKYYEAQAEQRNIPNIKVAHFSKPPVAGNVNNLPQNGAQNNQYNMPYNNQYNNRNINNNQYNVQNNYNNQYNYQNAQTGRLHFADAVRNIAQNVFQSRFRKLFIALYLLFCPSVLMIILSALMMKTNDPQIQRFARIAIFIGIFKIFVPWFL